MKVGVIGIGAIGPVHISALLDAGQEIIALCDIREERCHRANAQFGLSALVYTDYKTMLNEARLDAVHICTPHYLHAEMVCFALEKGIHVLCEKPLAINFSQLDDIENAVKTSTAQLGVCFQNRYNASVRYVKEFFKDKQITAASTNLIWRRDAAYYQSDTWRGTKSQEGGGVMINQAIHSLDMLQWICGMPESVVAHLSNNSLQGIIEVEDTAFGLFTLPNGGNFIINATNAGAQSLPISSMFQAGNDVIELSGDKLIVNGAFIEQNETLPLCGKKEWGVGHCYLINTFYDCLQTGKKFPIDFYEGEKSIRLVLKMYQSQGEKIKTTDER